MTKECEPRLQRKHAYYKVSGCVGAGGREYKQTSADLLLTHIWTFRCLTAKAWLSPAPTEGGQRKARIVGLVETDLNCYIATNA